MGLTISSTAFGPGAEIPVLYTCEGRNVSPPLAWSGVPEGAKSLALVVEDPDVPDPAAPKRTWVHWVLFNLPPDSKGLPEATTAAKLPPGTKEGLGDSKTKGYGGPCPPRGRHRYQHKLYALDALLNLEAPNKKELERAMAGHILAQAELIGTYQKKGLPRAT